MSLLGDRQKRAVGACRHRRLLFATFPHCYSYRRFFAFIRERLRHTTEPEPLLTRPRRPVDSSDIESDMEYDDTSDEIRKPWHPRQARRKAVSHDCIVMISGVLVLVGLLGIGLIRGCRRRRPMPTSRRTTARS